MGEKGVAGRGVEMMNQRKTRRGAARRDVADVVLNLPRADPVVLPGVRLTERKNPTNPTVRPDATPIQMRRRIGHTVLLGTPNALADLVHHAAAQTPLVIHPPLNRPPLSHPRWTSISMNRMTLV